jgi:hypothetical protein
MGDVFVFLNKSSSSFAGHSGSGLTRDPETIINQLSILRGTEYEY